MTSLMEDAFGHHVWATLTLADACLALPPDQLQTTVPGTYGSIHDTMRHIVGADASYLYVTSGKTFPPIDEEQMTFQQLRDQMATHDEWWSKVLASADPDQMLTRHRDDGSTTTAPMSIRLAQAVHHGTDHRSQICTALTTLGVEPPFIDVWDYGEQAGTVTETPPTA
jgi:uncharacterized damage-inducible protein DinB